MKKGFDEILKNIPARKSRFPLERYRPFLEELRRRGLSLREIARILSDQCGIQTSQVAVQKLLNITPRKSLAPRVAPTRPAKFEGKRQTASSGTFHFERERTIAP